MPPIRESRIPISDLASVQAELEELQGNILRSHRRSMANHILIRVDPATSVDVVRSAIGATGQRVTSAWAQEMERITQDFSATFFGLGIAAAGYRALGFEPPSNLRPLLESQLPTAQMRLDAPEWQALSAVVIVASNHPERLWEETGTVLARFQGIAVTHVEQGQQLLHPTTNKPIEHFGFEDSISQPLFFSSSAQRVRGHEFDASAGPYLVLYPDPYAVAGEPDSGSFLVMLKIEQNLRGFRQAAEGLVHALHIPLELAEAYLVGRFRDGTPLAESGVPGSPTNDFSYSADPKGRRCPMAAHIRKVGPRDLVDGSSAVRVARRGIPYGDPVPHDTPTEDLPETARGLLFQCVQRDIPTQFEKIFREWAIDNRFPSHGSGTDPIVSPAGGSGEWPTGWDTLPVQTPSIQSFVRYLGGEYFFLPSIPFLRSLA